MPAWGEERIRNMIATRPDWCISRQRLWGVPIPAFYCKGCGEILLRADLARHVAGLFEAETADAWYAREAGELLPAGFACPKCGGAAFDKETDILDVWFDSGSSHAAVLGQRDDLPWPADVYLEGSDQHRGWFHSSLLIGVATRGRAPYRQVITHGFTVDGEGRKISKSLGNDVDTQKLINTYGAEVLRLWTIMVDYREDMRISDDMIKRVAEAYRKVRNTIRYLVSNLNDFDPARDTVAEGDLDELDRYALHRHRQVVARVLDAYDAYEFHLVYHQLVQYAASDLSSFYLDVLKDRLYCDAADGHAAPLRPDRAPPDRAGPVPPAGPRPPLHHRRGLALRPRPPGALRPPRPLPRARDGGRGAPLPLGRPPRRAGRGHEGPRGRPRREAAGGEPRGRGRAARAGERARAAAGPRGEEPGLPGQPRQPVHRERRAPGGGRGAARVSVEHAPGAKCERCWTWSKGVGTLAVHPGVCERCAEVLAHP